ncbi:unnamed protein product [Leuciscus chuanchicus]
MPGPGFSGREQQSQNRFGPYPWKRAREKKNLEFRRGGCHSRYSVGRYPTSNTSPRSRTELDQIWPTLGPNRLKGIRSWPSSGPDEKKTDRARYWPKRHRRESVARIWPRTYEAISDDSKAGPSQPSEDLQEGSHTWSPPVKKSNDFTALIEYAVLYLSVVAHRTGIVISVLAGTHMIAMNTDQAMRKWWKWLNTQLLLHQRRVATQTLNYRSWLLFRV